MSNSADPRQQALARRIQADPDLRLKLQTGVELCGQALRDCQHGYDGLLGDRIELVRTTRHPDVFLGFVIGLQCAIAPGTVL